MTIHLHIKNAELKLMEMLNANRDPMGWLATHFHLDQLLEQYKSEYQIKIAVNLIYDLLKNYDGGIFLLADHSIVVLSKDLEKPLHNKLIFQLRYLYMDDVLAYTDTGQENSAFCTIYDLRRQMQEFRDLSARHMASSVRQPGMSARDLKPVAEKSEVRAAPVIEMPQEKEIDREKEKEPMAAPLKAAKPGTMSVSRLAIIEQDLASVDLHRAIRRQPVCAVLPGSNIRRVFDELYIHIAHLRQALRIDVDFLSNRWLFKYLTHLLDNRMLELIQTSPGRYLDSPISLNLNVETLLSKQFDAFDASLKPATKVSIVIEVPVVDIFADMAAFMLARAEVQKRGYRVCLDGLTTASFTSINREKLGLDLLKVQWNADLQSDIASKDNQPLVEAVKLTGTNRIILCRCDNKSAVEFGQALGISLFQGRYLDDLLDPAAKVKN